jgi:hypothetical protein
MNRLNLLFSLLFLLFSGYGLCTKECFGQIPPAKVSQKEPVIENQILYNGKAWRNMYVMVQGDQFLFSKDFLPALITINGNTYKDIFVNYDIFNDELITSKNNGTIVQLNKEIVDSFTLVFGVKNYLFKNIDADSLDGIKGYVNVLYSGRSSLYVKYKKEIDLLAVDDKYDLFFRTLKIYLLKNGKIYQLNNKSDMLKALEEEKIQIKAFMKKNGLKVSKKEPESFVPLIKYYDSISK